LVVSVDVPPQDGETDEQRVERENTNAARGVRPQQELAAAALTTGQHAGNAGQGDNNVRMQAPQLQQILSHTSKAMNLVETACLPEAS
jgi:hypothetical protein